MIDNLSDFFSAEQEFYLDKISYQRIDKNEQVKEYSLNWTDSLDVSINKNSVNLVINRTLKFDPEAVFALSVSFGAILQFREDRRKDLDWQKIDLAEEFKENGQFVLDNLMCRMSLLIAEITASFGQSPIILPPIIAPKN